MQKKTQPLSEETLKWLWSVVGKPGSDDGDLYQYSLPSFEVLSELSMYIREDAVFAYRAISLFPNEKVFDLGLDKSDSWPKFGSQRIYSPNRITSWTHDIDFARNWLRSMAGSGFIMKAKIKPDQIVVDTALLPKNTVKYASEQELLMRPGQVSVEIVETVAYPKDQKVS